MIARISKSTISQIKMLYDPRGKTMSEWHSTYGFDYAINTVLFDLNYSGLAGYLTTDGIIRCQSAYPYGFASDGTYSVQWATSSSYSVQVVFTDTGFTVKPNSTVTLGYIAFR